MTLVYRTQQLAEYWANSGSPQDIQNAVDQALGGGNVYVPEGEFVFNPNDAPSGIGVQIPSGVNVFGAGKDKTILRQTRRVDGNIPMFKVSGRYVSSDKTSRISGFTFIGYIVDEVDGHLATGVTMYCCKNFRVDHCNFIDFNHFDIATSIYTVAERLEDGVYQYYWNWGVVDHCDFDLPYKDTIGGMWGYGVDVNGPGRQDSWLYNLSDILGQFPETPPKCALYTWNASTSKYDLVSVYGGKYFRWLVYIEDCNFSRNRHAIASISGAFYVVRNCTFKEPRPKNYPMIDVHGALGVDWWSGRGAEVYNNTLYAAEGYTGSCAIDYRGGGGVVFNNTIINCTYGVRLSHDADQQVCWIKDLWIWNNNYQNVTVPINHWYSPSPYQEEVHYFLRPRPDYTPYTYPHPLVSGEQPPQPTTPFLGELEEGTYVITVPTSVIDGSNTYNFKQWEDGTTNPVRTINLTVDMTIIATYELQTVIINAVAGANGSVSPSGAVTMTVGQVYQFQATPNADYNFDHWDLGGANIGSTNPLPLVATADMKAKILTALFTAIPPQQVSMTVAFDSTKGTVNLATGVHLFNVGDTIQFMAVAKTGFTFKQWTLNGTPPFVDNPLNLLITADMAGKTLTAEFISPTPKFPVLQAGLGLLGIVGLVYLATRKG